MATIYKLGSKGDGVKAIQKFLKVFADGYYGHMTKEAVMDYQKSHGLTADGVVGPATLLKMGLTAIGSQSQAAGNDGIHHGNIWLKKSHRTITDIVIHCTATREGQVSTVDQIRYEHKRQGWSDIGYQYVVYLDGSVHIGRDVNIAGAHVAGHNAHSIGIAYVGGLENRPNVPYTQLRAKDTRTEAQKAALLSLLMDLRKLYPKAKISGHRDFSPDKNHDGVITPDEWIKDCPCFDAKAEYSRI